MGKELFDNIPSKVEDLLREVELGKIGLPRLSENMDPDDARALRNYLYQMQEQLQYVLSNLDTENLSEELRTRLQKLP